MATTVKVMSEQKRARYSAEYRAEALSLAERVGVAAAARELGLYATQIYQWRSKAAHDRGVSDRERELREENARLKRQLAGLAVPGSGHRSLHPQGDWLGEQSTN